MFRATRAQAHDGHADSRQALVNQSRQASHEGWELLLAGPLSLLLQGPECTFHSGGCHCALTCVLQHLAVERRSTLRW